MLNDECRMMNDRVTVRPSDRSTMKPHVDRYRVRSYECTPEGVLRAPELLNYLQETASENARVLGFDFPVFDEATGARGAWVLAQMRLRVDRYPRWRDTVLVDTFPWGARALTANRDFAVSLEDGTPCAVATTRWMLIDPATRKPVRLPPSIGAVDAGREPVFGVPDAFSRLRWPDPPAEETPPQAYRVMRSQIDLNGHVNNVHYAEWMLESVPADFAAAHRPVEMEIVFRSETLRGDVVESRTLPGPPAPDGSPTFLHRVSDPAGRDHVLGRTRWRALSTNC